MPRGRQRYGPELRNTYSFSTDPALIDVLERARAARFADLSRSALIGLAVRAWLEREGFPVPPREPSRAARHTPPGGVGGPSVASGATPQPARPPRP